MLRLVYVKFVIWYSDSLCKSIIIILNCRTKLSLQQNLSLRYVTNTKLLMFSRTNGELLTSDSITLTSPCYRCSVNPPTSYSEMWGEKGTWTVFLISAQKHRLKALNRTAWSLVPTIYVSSRNKKHITNYHLKIAIHMAMTNSLIFYRNVIPKKAKLTSTHKNPWLLFLWRLTLTITPCLKSIAPLAYMNPSLISASNGGASQLLEFAGTTSRWAINRYGVSFRLRPLIVYNML